ncbi:SDR family NAD(P)-dependent oxidoreductase [Rhizobium leguminosarum]|uniref:SDR family NAD(P)-dependent oxidoreductase n=1 Tax=Rhizobium leguminosarum TaxID=384 RepID=UPI0028F44CA9|nr:SDR family NAD(P)-dependent oxidoreductase [Rhizobium leguminosarum]
MTTTPQVALVTGATSGIGKATAIALAAAGFQVIGTGRNTAQLVPPAGVIYLDLDVTSDESVASAVNQVIDRFGHVDVLVNNAGVGTTGAAEEFSITQTQDIFDINVFGVMRTTKAVLPHMRAQGRGRIINVSSLSGFVPSPFMALYVSTKHAVEGYSQSLDHEVRHCGVRVLLARPDQHSVRRSQRGGRHPHAALRGGTAQLRRSAGEEPQQWRRPCGRRHGDRRGGHRPEPETTAHRR